MSNYKDLIFDKSFINGEWTDGTGKKLEITNPADGTEVAKVYNHDISHVKKAIDAAHDAFPTWSGKTAKERSGIMKKWFDLIMKNKDEIAHIMALESAKPLAECKGEIDYGAGFVEWYAEQAKRNNGSTIPGYTEDRRVKVIKQPVGVVGAITPWNFPLAMITRKIAPALSIGCTIVSRPSISTPLTALTLVHLAEKAGFPKGVFNMVIGDDSSAMGKELCENPKVAKISFTGSTRVGKILMEQCSQDLKRLSLELGGNAPLIVFEDANIDDAVEGAMAGKFRFSGQTCVCVNRILVHENVHNEFVEKFVKAAQNLKIGPGLEEGVNFGALINTKAVEKMQGFVDDAKEKGGKVLHGGKKIDDHFYPPTVITNATPEMKFAKEEIFGPVAPIFKFKTEEEAIQMANDTVYGLASYYYTNDLNRSIRMSEQLEYGIVGLNTGLISNESVPFGGIKHSGFGREGSVYGLEDFVHIKYICTGNVK
ncbi:succinate-semialdehyde dehydrogenase [Flavobacteriaceae bacterium Ap0902]|nr:succinate-semialdehyde dehydrogenase [Flavobacteriaceae bacterium Ap0902]